MKRLIIGILAHVDAGKTTLSEAMLYESGNLRKFGRVDHQDAFLDHDVQERERGITIFSKQAIMQLENAQLTLLDTPGHVDFSSEMERTLQVLDYAILVISGSDGVQSHTRTLWKLLKRYEIPTFLFINKMDLNGTDAEGVQAQLQELLDDGCIDFTHQTEEFMETAAMCDEEAMNEFLENGAVAKETLQRMIRERKLFPCFYGSALKLEGVKEFLQGMEEYTFNRPYPRAFGAKVYKISHDPQGNRLTYMKITGGALHVKDYMHGPGWDEKIDQIRLYSGTKFQLVDQLEAGSVCAVTGLSKTKPGEGFGIEEDSKAPVLDSFLTYQVILPAGMEPHTAMQKFRILEEEDPQLHVVWNEQLKEIHVQLMGEVQLEVLSRLVQDRFGMTITFGQGNIVYRETIQAPVVGMGHFEPLRHYAEVHLLLEPGESGSGLSLGTACSEDELDRNWQRLILTHLEERIYKGVLTGSPITDMKITLVAGRAHLKHTEGGDFRQATYRAVRQGLMQAESVLLEPWYEFQLEVPTQHVGRAMADLQRLHANFESPEAQQDVSILKGTAPAATMQGYALEVTAYTKGLGHLICLPKGYAPCHNADEVIAKLAYDAEKDLDNTGDSVFCAHGAGFVVKWDQVQDYMHLDSGIRFEAKPKAVQETAKPKKSVDTGSGSLDAELQAIFERTYGEIKQRDIRPNRVNARMEKEDRYDFMDVPEFLLVDGYNIVHAWDDLRDVAWENMDLARQMLLDQVCAYQSVRKCHCIVVFDAYRVERAVEDVLQYHNIHVVFTKQAETADTYIERATYEISKRHRVRVATSDNAEQMIVMGHGAFRMSAREFKEEVELAKKVLESNVRDWNRSEKDRIGQQIFDKRNRTKGIAK